MSSDDRPPRAWVLNLDAESELETHGQYVPGKHMRAIVRAQRVRLLGNLVAPGDVLLTDEEPERDVSGMIGLAWSPTPSALARLRRAGAIPAASPAIDVLRTVNARPFTCGVRAPLVRDSFEKRVVRTLDETLQALSEPAPLGWLVRRSFGAAGRGRRKVQAGRPGDDERAWIRASLRLGPLVIEPWVEITREYTRSGWVRAGGAVVIAAPCFQETTKAGAWTRTECAQANEVLREEDTRLEQAAEAAGRALARAGYAGPFGIDAFRHRLPGGRREVLNPMSEINARFTMDWATGMTARPERVPLG